MKDCMPTFFCIYKSVFASCCEARAPAGVISLRVQLPVFGQVIIVQAATALPPHNLLLALLKTFVFISLQQKNDIDADNK